jgi:hypothetical protein
MAHGGDTDSDDGDGRRERFPVETTERRRCLEGRGSGRSRREGRRLRGRRAARGADPPSAATAATRVGTAFGTGGDVFAVGLRCLAAAAPAQAAGVKVLPWKWRPPLGSTRRLRSRFCVRGPWTGSEPARDRPASLACDVRPQRWWITADNASLHCRLVLRSYLGRSFSSPPPSSSRCSTSTSRFVSRRAAAAAWVPRGVLLPRQRLRKRRPAFSRPALDMASQRRTEVF